MATNDSVKHLHDAKSYLSSKMWIKNSTPRAVQMAGLRVIGSLDENEGNKLQKINKDNEPHFLRKHMGVLYTYSLIHCIFKLILFMNKTIFFGEILASHILSS